MISAIKTVKGLPSQKSIRELCKKYYLPLYSLSSVYTRTGRINWSGTRGDAPAALVASELRIAGFDVILAPARPQDGITGSLTILMEGKP